jgi:Putative zinc-finger/Lon protease (S16) C-terminal proteolytic domain
MKPHVDLIGFIEGILSEEENLKVKNHLASCPNCKDEYDKLSKTASLFRLAELFKPGLLCPEPQRYVLLVLDMIDTAERAQLEFHAKKCDECKALLQDLNLAIKQEVSMPDPKEWKPLPKALEIQISAKKPRSEISEDPIPAIKIEKYKTKTVQVEAGPDFVRMAAAKSDTPMSTFEGKAIGVAVPEVGSDQGQLFEVTAGIRNETVPEGKLSIFGIQDERGYRRGATKPLDLLKAHVAELFKHLDCMRQFELTNRIVSIKIEGKISSDKPIVGYLGEEKSLMLAVIVAVMKAMTSIEVDDDYAFSGDVSFRGELISVGRVLEKANLAADEGFTLVLPDKTKHGNRELNTKTLLKSEGLNSDQFKTYKSIDDLLKSLFGIRLHNRTASFFNLLFYIISALILLAFCSGAYVSGDFFFISRLLIAYHLKDPSGIIFDSITLINTVITLFSFLVITYVFRQIKKQKCISFRCWLIKLIKVLSLSSWVLLAANGTCYINHLFEGLDRIERYEKVKHLIPLKNKPIFSLFLDQTSDISYEVFDDSYRRYREGKKNQDAYKTLDLGLNIQFEAITDDAVSRAGNIFMKTAEILSDDRLNRTPGSEDLKDKALMLIDRYLKFAGSLDQHQKASEEFIFDTIDAALETQKDFKLEGHYQGGMTFGSRFRALKSKYGVK